MRRAALLLSAIIALGLSFAAAGCGGGGGGKALSKSEFIAKADGICAAGNKNAPKPPDDLKNVNPTSPSTTKKQLDEFGTYLEDIVKHFRSELDDLHGVKPPADLQNKYDTALAALDESLNEIGGAAKAAHKGDRETLKVKLTESDKHSTQANKLAKELGLTVCGSGSG